MQKITVYDLYNYIMVEYPLYLATIKIYIKLLTRLTVTDGVHLFTYLFIIYLIMSPA